MLDDEFLVRVRDSIGSTSALVKKYDKDQFRHIVQILLDSSSIDAKTKALSEIGYTNNKVWVASLSRRVKAEFITFKRSIEPTFDFEVDVEEKLDRLQHLMNQQYDRLVLALEEDTNGVDILTFDERVEVLTDEEKTRLAGLLREHYTNKLSTSDRQYLMSFTSRRSSDSKLEEKLDKYFKMVQQFYELKKQISGLRRITERDRADSAKPVALISSTSRFTKVQTKKVEDDDELDEEVG